MKAAQTEYIPGTCNINFEEIAYRRRVSNISFAISIALLVFLVFADVSRWTRIVLFLPLLIAFACYLQAKNRFCVTYGSIGEQNATPGSKKSSKVADTDAVAKDKKRASEIKRQAVVLAVIATAFCLVIPEM